jgi:NAD(P)-dependent dehydrogenase (short-subunit alcohol dehydrogenase family)
MVENDGGSIVLSAAAVARTGVFNHEAIAAKGGSIGLTRAASTYARNAVRVNCVAPGAWWRRRSPSASLKTRPEANREQSLSMHALDGRLGG